MPTVRTQENIDVVEGTVDEDLTVSIRHRVEQLKSCPSTLWSILRKDLGMQAYKFLFDQEFGPTYHCFRHEFSAKCENQLEVDPLIYRKKIFVCLRQVTFLNSFVNK